MKWHSTLRERLVKTGKGDRYDTRFGRFLPSQCYNADQSPVPFAIDTKKTYELLDKKNPENKNKKVWVSQPTLGLEKRQCTLQICARAAGQQPRIAIIFRGKGLRISAGEKASWRASVVYFQDNAWANTQFCINWANRTLKEAVDDIFVLFMDNLSGQIQDDFKKCMSDLGRVGWYGVAGATDIWQPIDAGYAELLKILVKYEQFRWLDNDENSDKWYRVETHLAHLKNPNNTMDWERLHEAP